MSGLQSDDAFQQSWEAGFDGHPVKPMTPELEDPAGGVARGDSRPEET